MLVVVDRCFFAGDDSIFACRLSPAFGALGGIRTHGCCCCSRGSKSKPTSPANGALILSLSVAPPPDPNAEDEIRRSPPSLPWLSFRDDCHFSAYPVCFCCKTPPAEVDANNRNRFFFFFKLPERTQEETHTGVGGHFICVCESGGYNSISPSDWMVLIHDLPLPPEALSSTRFACRAF